jgi:hypothetical protein
MNHPIRKTISYVVVILSLIIPQISRAQTGPDATALGLGCSATGTA